MTEELKGCGSHSCIVNPPKSGQIGTNAIKCWCADWKKMLVFQKLRAERDRLAAELRNIAEAKRFDREKFEDDRVFADWAQSRARFTLAAMKEQGK